jgi:hypothetical protein
MSEMWLPKDKEDHPPNQLHIEGEWILFYGQQKMTYKTKFVIIETDLEGKFVSILWGSVFDTEKDANDAVVYAKDEDASLGWNRNYKVVWIVGEKDE